MKKSIIILLALVIILLVLLWCKISITIQAFKCPQMTQTELFLNMPKSFMCEWRVCDTNNNNNK